MKATDCLALRAPSDTRPVGRPSSHWITRQDPKTGRPGHEPDHIPKVDTGQVTSPHLQCIRVNAEDCEASSQPGSAVQPAAEQRNIPAEDYIMVEARGSESHVQPGKTNKRASLRITQQPAARPLHRANPNNTASSRASTHAKELWHGHTSRLTPTRVQMFA
jgi:hypothetical protein